MTFTIEPMVNAGKRHVRLLPDGWTVVTKDHSLSAQWEHTLLVTAEGYDVLTLGAAERYRDAHTPCRTDRMPTTAIWRSSVWNRLTFQQSASAASIAAKTATRARADDRPVERFQPRRVRLTRWSTPAPQLSTLLIRIDVAMRAATNLQQCGARRCRRLWPRRVAPLFRRRRHDLYCELRIDRRLAVGFSDVTCGTRSGYRPQRPNRRRLRERSAQLTSPSRPH